MEEKTNCFPLNGIRICIDNKDSNMEGRAYSPLWKACITFCGLEELLLKADKVFDEKGYPQAFQEKRSFLGKKCRPAAFRGLPSPETDEKTILSQQGMLETYDIVVESRRNTSWQGCVYKAGKKIGDFCGELELIGCLL